MSIAAIPSEDFLKDALEVFKGLVRIDTTNPPGGESRAVHYLMGLLKAQGIDSRCLEREPERGNLIARLKGQGEKPPLILISHLDVVPAEPKKWRFGPFSAEEADEMIWGRGTLDTKQLTAMQVAAFTHLKQYDGRLNRDVFLVASADEERGSSLGMEWLVGEMPELLQPALIISEGGGFPIRSNNHEFLLCAAGEKGVCRIRLSASGTGGHASSPPTGQAIHQLARGLERLLSYKFQKKFTPVARNFLIETGLNPSDPKILGSTLGALTQHMLLNHWVVNEIAVGSATNSIPQTAEVELELRILPGVTRKEVTSLLMKVFYGSPLQWEIVHFKEGFESDLHSELLEAFQRNCNQYGFDGTVLPFIALGSTDGRFLATRGTSIYGFSPVLQADNFSEVLQRVHGDNERIAISSFLFGTRVMTRTLVDLCVENGDDR